jgi:hypothetical protein
MPKYSRALALMGNQRGQSMIEFVLTAPVLLLLVLGSFDLGMAMWRKMQLSHAITSGIRTAATQETADDSQVKTIIQNAADFVENSNISINRNYMILVADDAVEISISYQYPLLTSMLPWVNLTLSTRMSMLKQET